MKITSLLICCLIGFLSAQAQTSHHLITDLESLQAGFQQPESFYGPSILWGWEGPITHEVIDRDLDQFKSLRIRSVDIEAGYDLPAPYLSDGYFELIKYAVEQAKKRGMVIWMIDESKYPSGFAGGLFSKERPDLRMQGIDVYKRVKLAGGETYTVDVPQNVLSAVATNKESGESQLLKIKDGKVNWTAPDGEWQILLAKHCFRTSVTRAGNNTTHGKDTVNSLCDYLNPAATKQFLEFTHIQYKKHVGDEFGKTFLGFRGDEPDYGFVPWTPKLPEEFMKRKGYDVRPWVASFMIKNPTDSMLRVKADYWDVWSDLFGKNFFKVQADWCAANNLQYMVHLNHEDKMMWMARSEGDFFEDLRHVQIPGVDAIWNQIWPGKVSDYPKYASSVAHVYGHPRSMSESFAAYRIRPNVDQAKWVVDYQFVRGINFFEWMYWPASTRGDGSPRGWFDDPKFPQVAQYSNRISYLLSNGTPTAKIAVYYPTDSEWLGDQQADSSALKLSQSLLETQHDYDFIDDNAILYVLSPMNGGVKNLSGQVYQTILIPTVLAMPKAVLDKLKDFSENGVKVVFTSQLPTLIAGKTYRNGGHSYDFSSMVQTHGQGYFQYLPTPDFKMKQTLKAVKYNHRHFLDGNLYFIFNESKSLVKTEVTLAGQGTVKKWDAVTGEMKAVESIQQGNSVHLKLDLGPWESKVFVVSNQYE